MESFLRRVCRNEWIWKGNSSILRSSILIYFWEKWQRRFLIILMCIVNIFRLEIDRLRNEWIWILGKEILQFFNFSILRSFILITFWKNRRFLIIDRLKYWNRDDDIIKVRELSVSPRMNGFEFWERKFFNSLFFQFDNFLERYFIFWKRWHCRFLIILICVVNIFRLEIDRLKYWKKNDEIIKNWEFCIASKWMDLKRKFLNSSFFYFDIFLFAKGDILDF